MNASGPVASTATLSVSHLMLSWSHSSLQSSAPLHATKTAPTSLIFTSISPPVKVIQLLIKKIIIILDIRNVLFIYFIIIKEKKNEEYVKLIWC